MTSKVNQSIGYRQYEQHVVNKRITVMQIARRTDDIIGLQHAIEDAEAVIEPDRTRLYEIYKRMELDNHLCAVMRRIVCMCTNTKIKWFVDGEADSDNPINQLLEKPYMQEVIKYILESEWYGHSLIQMNFLEKNFNEENTPGIELIPRHHVRPEYQEIKVDWSQQQVINYCEAPYNAFLMEVGGRRDIGLLAKAATEILPKLCTKEDWDCASAEYSRPKEKFEYDPNDPKGEAQAIKAAKNQGGNAKIIMAAGTGYELIDTKQGAWSQAYEKKTNHHDQKISMLFLLQTMTTFDGSSRSQGEVHERAEKSAIQAYKILVTNTFNTKLKSLLQKHGYNIDGEFRYDETEKLTKKEQAELLKCLKELGYTPSKETLEEMFGMELEEVSQSNDTEPNDDPDDPDEPNEPEDEPDEPEEEVEEQSYIPKKKSEIKLIGNTINYDSMCNHSHIETLDFSTEGIDPIEEQLLREAWEGQSKGLNWRHFVFQLSNLRDALFSGWGEIEEDWNAPDHQAQWNLENNLFRFSAAKSAATIIDLNKLVNDARDFSDFKLKAEPLLKDYNLNYLRTEYNFTQAVSQNARAWQQAQADKEVFPYLTYQTIGDERVRPGHEALDGFTAAVDDNIWSQFYPPNGWGCRCEVIQTDEEPEETKTLDDAVAAFGGDEYAAMKKAGMDINRGDSGVVFQQNQMYLRQYDVDSLSFEEFERPKHADIDTSDFTGSMTAREARKWFADKKGDNDMDIKSAIRLIDYSEKPITLSNSTVNKLIKRNRNLVASIENTITNPDEVYYMEDGNRHYYTFHKSVAHKIVVEKKDGKQPRIKSITEVKDVDAERKGILINYANDDR